MKQFIAAVFICIAASASSQELSFEQALHIMSEQSPMLKALHYERRAAQRERQAAIGLFMPQVEIMAAYTHLDKDVRIDLNDTKQGLSQGLTNILTSFASDATLGPIVAPLMPDIEKGLQSLFGADWGYTLQQRNFGFIGYQVNIPIFTGGKILAANRAAKIEEQLVDTRSAQQRNKLITKLVERYFGYAMTQRLVALHKDVVSAVRQHLADVRNLEENGMAVKADRLYVEYRLTEAERELLDAEERHATAKQALQMLLGGTAISATSTPIFTLNIIESREFFAHLAAEQNPALEELEGKKQLARQNITLRRAALMPEIVAMGGGSIYSKNLSPLVSRWMVGVGARITIFSGLRNEYRLAAARNTLRRVEQLQHEAESDVSLLVASLYAEVEGHRRRVASLKRSESFAEEYLRSKRLAFAEGAATSTEIVDAELNLSKVRLERLDAAYKYDVALARLLEAAGVSDRFLSYMNRHAAQILTDL